MAVKSLGGKALAAMVGSRRRAGINAGGADMAQNVSPWLANWTLVDTSPPPRDPNDDNEREEEEHEEDEEDQDQEPAVVREPDE
jgi:hypothetical protein